MSRTNIITVEDVMNLTHGGEDVFLREVGEISYTRNVKSPFRTDSNPSAKLSKSVKGEVFLNDFGGNQWSGSAISLIQELYGLSFQQALEKIWKDFNGNESKLERIVKVPTITPVKKKPLLFEFNDCRFTDRHRKYMDNYYLDEEYLNSKDVWAVDKFAIDKKIIPKTHGEYNFAYVPRDEKENIIHGKLKILSLGPNVKKKWINNLPNSFLWGLHTVSSECKQIFLVKSNKDYLVLNKHFGIRGVVTQNESAKIYLKHNAEKLESICKNIVICYGSDQQGKEQSIEISKTRGYSWFNTPNNVLKNFNGEDTADYVKLFGVNSLGNLLKKKGYL